MASAREAQIKYISEVLLIGRLEISLEDPEELDYLYSRYKYLACQVAGTKTVERSPRQAHIFYEAFLEFCRNAARIERLEKELWWHFGDLGNRGRQEFLCRLKSESITRFSEKEEAIFPEKEEAFFSEREQAAIRRFQHNYHQIVRGTNWDNYSKMFSTIWW